MDSARKFITVSEAESLGNDDSDPCKYFLVIRRTDLGNKVYPRLSNEHVAILQDRATAAYYRVFFFLQDDELTFPSMDENDMVELEPCVRFVNSQGTVCFFPASR